AGEVRGIAKVRDAAALPALIGIRAGQGTDHQDGGDRSDAVRSGAAGKAIVAAAEAAWRLLSLDCPLRRAAQALRREDAPDGRSDPRDPGRDRLRLDPLVARTSASGPRPAPCPASATATAKAAAACPLGNENASGLSTMATK